MIMIVNTVAGPWISMGFKRHDPARMRRIAIDG